MNQQNHSIDDSISPRVSDMDRLLNTRETMAVIGVCRTKLYHMVKAGEFPAPHKIGRRNYWRRSDLERYLAGL